MRAAALVLLLAFAARAEEPPRVVVQVRDGYVRKLDGETLQIRGGAWLDGPTLMATGKEVAALRAENSSLREAPVAPPSSLAVAVLVGVAVGLAGGVAMTLWATR